MLPLPCSLRCLQCCCSAGTWWLQLLAFALMHMCISIAGVTCNRAALLADCPFLSVFLCYDALNVSCVSSFLPSCCTLAHTRVPRRGGVARLTGICRGTTCSSAVCVFDSLQQLGSSLCCLRRLLDRHLGCCGCARCLGVFVL